MLKKDFNDRKYTDMLERVYDAARDISLETENWSCKLEIGVLNVLFDTNAFYYNPHQKSKGVLKVSYEHRVSNINGNNFYDDINDKVSFFGWALWQHRKELEETKALLEAYEEKLRRDQN